MIADEHADVPAGIPDSPGIVSVRRSDLGGLLADGGLPPPVPERLLIVGRPRRRLHGAGAHHPGREEADCYSLRAVGRAFERPACLSQPAPDDRFKSVQQPVTGVNPILTGRHRWRRVLRWQEIRRRE